MCKTFHARLSWIIFDRCRWNLDLLKVHLNATNIYEKFYLSIYISMYENTIMKVYIEISRMTLCSNVFAVNGCNIIYLYAYEVRRFVNQVGGNSLQISHQNSAVVLGLLTSAGRRCRPSRVVRQNRVVRDLTTAVHRAVCDAQTSLENYSQQAKSDESTLPQSIL